MTMPSAYEFLELCSQADEPAFFAAMGRFFASREVRKACGGYPLNDGPGFTWFVVRRPESFPVLGFISVERCPDIVHFREGYLCPDVRGLGLFRALRRRVLEYADAQGLASRVCVQPESARLLARHGFKALSTRGKWVTMERRRHA